MAKASAEVPTFLDWCHSCGCVVSTKHFEKGQVEAPKPADLLDLHFFGEKEIPFAIKAHDPREFETFKKYWDDNPQLEYDEAEREEEVFLHRVGQSPNLSTLSSLIALCPKDQVAKTGKLAYTMSSDISANETDAIIIDDSRHATLIHGLNRLTISERCLIVTASWNKHARSGILKIELRLPNDFFMGYSVKRSIQDSHWLPGFLATWFDCEFELQDLCRHTKASPKEMMKKFQNPNRYSGSSSIQIPFLPTRLGIQILKDPVKQLLESHCEEFKSARKTYEDSLTLSPSDGRNGGIADCSDISFKGSLTRYFQERFQYILKEPSMAGIAGVTRGQTNRKSDFLGLDAVVGYQNAVIAESCFLRRGGKNLSTNDIMARLENLGHESELVVEGLNVELLPFQKQSLKLCLERENTPGGINALLWPKLPSRGPGNSEDLYFNPILNQFRTTKPALARGGLLCEQMVR